MASFLRAAANKGRLLLQSRYTNLDLPLQIAYLGQFDPILQPVHFSKFLLNCGSYLRAATIEVIPSEGAATI